MKLFNFTLVLQGVNDQTEGLEDALYEAGCDDGLVNFRNGTVYIEFDRKAENIEAAIMSAIKAVEGSTFTPIVASVTPDVFVGESEIARRINQKRQTISNWVKGRRRKHNPFPTPVMGLYQKSPIWRWQDVAFWLLSESHIDDPNEVEEAKFLEAINAALFERNQTARKECHRLVKNLPKLKRL